MVNLVGPGSLDRSREAGRVENVPLDQLDLIPYVLGGAQRFRRRAPDDARDRIVLGKEELGEERTVLAGQAGDERAGPAQAGRPLLRS